jgi:hypothetical protein
MDKWEYRTVFVSYAHIRGSKGLFKMEKDWVVNYSDGSQTVGFEKILNKYGELGWELVNVVVEHSLGEGSASTDQYRLFFKKRII